MINVTMTTTVAEATKNHKPVVTEGSKESQGDLAGDEFLQLGSRVSSLTRTTDATTASGRLPSRRGRETGTRPGEPEAIGPRRRIAAHPQRSPG